MTKLAVLLSAALILLGACQNAPAATPLPKLPELFSGQELTLVKLVVQGKEIPIPAAITATITFASDGKISGSGGCNRYFGGFESPTPGRVTFSAIGSTKMYCQDKMAVEDGLFQTLAKTAIYRLDNARLVLESADGQYAASFSAPGK